MNAVVIKYNSFTGRQTEIYYNRHVVVATLTLFIAASFQTY
jgi:hypothetical protein